MKSKFSIKQILQDHWSDFSSEHNIRPVVLTEVKKTMHCGNPSNGYALYFCEHCFKFKHVPFRCKSRFCINVKIFLYNCANISMYSLASFRY